MRITNFIIIHVSLFPSVIFSIGMFPPGQKPRASAFLAYDEQGPGAGPHAYTADSYCKHDSERK